MVELGTGIVALAALVGLFVVLGLAWRVHHLRVTGVPIILRYLPAGDGAGWRHGTLRYDDHEVRFYRLSSVRIGPSWVLPRIGTEIVGRRRAEAGELDLIEPAMTVVHTDSPNGETELAFERDGLTAFQSWLESRPSARRQRS